MAIRVARGVTTGRGIPRRSEGQNGDITVRITRHGTKLYIKESNKWHTVDLNVDALSMVRDVNSLKEDVKKLQTRAKNTPMVDKILLRQPNSASSVAIQNKSGLFALRNSADSADAKFQSIALDTGTDNASGKGWGQLYYSSEASSKSHYLESKGLIVHSGLNSPDDVSHSKLFLINSKSDSAVVMYEGALGKYVMGYDNVKSTTFTDSTCDTTSGDATVSMDDVSALIVGSTVSGTGIPADATIDSINSGANTFELSANATANGTNVTLTFQTADGRFKIHNGASFADDSIFNLDTSGIDIQGNITASGDLTVTGADITIGADADGTDRNVVFGHSTLKTIMGIDDSADAFIINTDAAFDATLANNSLTIDASHNITVGGNLQVTGNRIQASDGGATITMDTSDNVTIGNNLACNEITAGAVVWQRFQFYIIGGNTARYYYLDHDDRYNSLAHWDNYSTIIGVGTDLTMLDERMAAFPEVAENCIFAGGIGTIYNDTGTDNPKISIFYDSSTLSGDEDQTEAFAPLVDTDVTINTQDRKYGFTLDAVTGTTLNAGCKYVPTVSNIATTVWGSMTLKFITK